MKIANFITDLIILALLVLILGFAVLAYNSPDRLADIACQLTTTNVVDEKICRIQQNLP